MWVRERERGGGVLMFINIELSIGLDSVEDNFLIGPDFNQPKCNQD